MKKGIVILMALMLCLFMTSAVCADTEDDAVAHVKATVLPNVAVNYPGGDVLVSVQAGEFAGTATFRIDANDQIIKIYCEASKLYKADDPTAPTVTPIPLDMAKGIDVVPADGNEMGAGADNNLPYDPLLLPPDVEGYPVMGTETSSFEASTDGHFSQDVAVTVHWDQDNPERPQGEYSGVIRIVAMMI